MAANGSSSSQTLARGLDVLGLVARSEHGLTPTEISAQLQLSRTIVYRLLVTLADYDLLRRNTHGRFTIGLGVLRLTDNFLGVLREVSRPVLERLAEETGATAHLSIAEGDESVAVIVVEPRATAYHLAYRAGVRQPLPLGAVGRALEAARSGTSGVFITHGELIPGTTGLAAAISEVAEMACTIGVVSLAKDLDVDRLAGQVTSASRQFVAALRPPVD